jgi:copper chaperone CopZ
MKKNVIIILLTAITLAACNNPDSAQSPSETEPEFEPADVVMVDMDVEGMTCTGCENTIKTGVSELDGVVEVSASHVDAKTFVKVDTSLTSIESIKETIKSKGYTVQSASVQESEDGQMEEDSAH